MFTFFADFAENQLLEGDGRELSALLPIGEIGVSREQKKETEKQKAT